MRPALERDANRHALGADALERQALARSTARHARSKENIHAHVTEPLTRSRAAAASTVASSASVSTMEPDGTKPRAIKSACSSEAGITQRRRGFFSPSAASVFRAKLTATRTPSRQSRRT